MKKNPHRQFPGKMDKLNKKTYPKGYAKAKHGNVKEGYHKLKHVKMFENFDQAVPSKWEDEVEVYDNGGKTADRYTVILPDGAVFNMSHNAMTPNGVNLYAGTADALPGARDGRRVEVNNLPEEVQRAIQNRLEDASDMAMGESKVNEVKAEAVATKNIRVAKKFKTMVDEMIELSKKFDELKEEYTTMSKLLGKYEKDVQEQLEKYGAQFVRMGSVAIELKKVKGRESKSYKQISEALEALLPATKEMQKAIENIHELNTKINPDKIKMEYAVQEGIQLDEKLTYQDLIEIGAPITNAIEKFIKKLGGWFKGIWGKIKKHLPKFEGDVNNLSKKLKPLGVQVPSTTEALKMMANMRGMSDSMYTGGNN